MERVDLIKSGMTAEQADAFLANMNTTASVSKDADGNFLPVNGVLVIPAEIANGVKASEMGGWFPPAPVAKTNVVWLSATERVKKSSGTDDLVVRFRVGTVSCKTYLSTLKGLWNELRTANKVQGDFLTENGAFRNTIELGYVAQPGNTQYPLRLEMSAR